MPPAAERIANVLQDRNSGFLPKLLTGAGRENLPADTRCVTPNMSEIDETDAAIEAVTASKT